MDEKYCEFCRKLVSQLYDENRHPDSGEPDKKVYDILGDDDFRLIARGVKLGKLLREYAPGGILCYTEEEFPYYLFSSGLVLNIKNEKESPIDPSYKQTSFEVMKQKFGSPCCNGLMQKINKITDVIQNDSYKDEKVVTFCQAVFQLLQSLKVLETAPTKRYDFYSLYYPFCALVDILENKMKERKDIGEHAEIYEFIHKISMTLHGTLRTDIQFFQIRDFNVIVHYAPAKLRAYYSLWALKLTKYYNMYNDINKKYSFVLAPGMYRGTSVKQLFTSYEEDVRLMLITIPERHLYAPRWLTVVLAHEVSHYVGSMLRDREDRHMIWLRISAHIVSLELHAYMYAGLEKFQPIMAEQAIRENTNLLEQLESKLIEQEKEVRDLYLEKYPFHSDNSIEIIQKAYRNISWHHLKQIIYEYGYLIRNNMIKQMAINTKNNQERSRNNRIIHDLCNEISEDMMIFFERIQERILESLLDMIGNITTETLADMMAIITLGLTPKEFILSFTKSEVNDYIISALNMREATVVEIRIAIVMHTVCELIKKNQTWFLQHSKEFAEAWEGDALLKCIETFKTASTEMKLVDRAWRYREGCENCQKRIRGYKRLYDVSKQEFSNDAFGFMKDRVIRDLLYEYLDNCADIYMSKLEKDDNIEAVRNELLQSHKKIAGNSCVDMMQEIEDFLQINENNNFY